MQIIELFIILGLRVCCVRYKLKN